MQRTVHIVVSAFILSSVVTACTTPISPPSSLTPNTMTHPRSATAELADHASSISDELAAAYAGVFAGTYVTVAGPFVDEDAVKFNAAVAEFEALTGIDIQYEGSKEFEASISIRVDGGNPPDIADFPQPGLLANFVRAGKVINIKSYIKSSWLQQNYNQGWLDMATMESPTGKIMAGVWNRVSSKSLVWYPKAAFDAAGYHIPNTWDELMALTEQMAADGEVPWCIGIESGAATGWPATDWIEDILLRTTSLENYDRWTRGDLGFDSVEVKSAVAKMSDIWFNDDYVLGGRAAIITTPFGDAPKPMFATPPACWLHKQANFITSFFPPGLTAGTDYAFFYLPPIDPAYGKPVLVAGDLYAAFSDRPEVRAVMSFFSSGASLEQWIRSGGTVAAHRDAPLEWYSNSIDRGVAEIMFNADSVRFDGSDMMPGQVGAGSFWKGITDYIGGTIELDAAMQEIDAAWPR